MNNKWCWAILLIVAGCIGGVIGPIAYHLKLAVWIFISIAVVLGIIWSGVWGIIADMKGWRKR